MSGWEFNGTVSSGLSRRSVHGRSTTVPEVVLARSTRPRVPALMNIATRLRIDSVLVHHRGRQRPPEHLLLGGRDHGGAVLLGDAVRPARSAKNPTTIGSCCRRVMPRRSCTPRGRRQASARARTSCRCASWRRISRGIRRRGCRWWTSRPDRSVRGCAPASASRSTRGASSRTTARTCCSATARRPKARSGKPPRWARCTTLDSLCGIIDVNALGQSRPTAVAARHGRLAARWRAFGWHAIVVDGHDVAAILDALAEARRTRGRPTMILARTIKGKGISLMEGKGGWHGKPLKKGEELEKALAELKSQFVAEDDEASTSGARSHPARAGQMPETSTPRAASRNGRRFRLQAG